MLLNCSEYLVFKYVRIKQAYWNRYLLLKYTYCYVNHLECISKSSCYADIFLL